jgi:hypothetical protein
MSESDTALHDEEVFSDELPDAVLEVAGSKCWEGPASSVTIGFCSGPETCPMRPALGGQVADQGRGQADRRQHRQAAGASKTLA